MKIGTNARNASVDGVTALLNGGTIKLYTGSQPANPQTAPSGTLLATIGLGSPAFAAAVGGSASMNATTPDTDADATGVAGWARFATSGGVGVFDVTVGVSGAEINLNSVNISAGAEVSVTAFTYTQPE